MPSWPELVGKTVQEAKATIEGLGEGYQVTIMDTMACTRDFWEKRVRVFH